MKVEDCVEDSLMGTLLQRLWIHRVFTGTNELSLGELLRSPLDGKWQDELPLDSERPGIKVGCAAL